MRSVTLQASDWNGHLECCGLPYNKTIRRWTFIWQRWNYICHSSWYICYKTYIHVWLSLLAHLGKSHAITYVGCHGELVVSPPFFPSLCLLFLSFWFIAEVSGLINLLFISHSCAVLQYPGSGTKHGFAKSRYPHIVWVEEFPGEKDKQNCITRSPKL